MFQFLYQNIGTIAVGAIVAGIVAAIVIKLARDRKKGKCLGCDCGCGGCESRSGCSTK